MEAWRGLVGIKLHEEVHELRPDGLLNLGHVLMNRDVHQSVPSRSLSISLSSWPSSDAEVELPTSEYPNADFTVSTVADTRVQPLSSSSAASSASGSSCTAIFCVGHAKSSEIPSSVSYPHSGTSATSEAASAFANSASSGSISGCESSSTHSDDNGTPPSGIGTRSEERRVGKGITTNLSK